MSLFYINRNLLKEVRILASQQYTDKQITNSTYMKKQIKTKHYN